MAITRTFTIADLDNFPDDGRRYEIIDGELYATAAPHADHQFLIDRLAAALVRWDPDNVHGVALSGAGVIFADDTGVIPDLVWVAADQAAILIDPTSGQRDGKIHSAPALVVEILSPGAANAARDRETKLTLYARREVGEYWIVARESQTVEVYRRAGATLGLAATVTAGDALTSPALPGFRLPTAEVFRLPAWFPQ